MAATIFCDTDRYCMAHEELPDFTGTCDNNAEPHSTLCEQHGGVADLESYQAEWEYYITDEGDLCEHILDGEDDEKVEKFRKGELHVK